MAKGLQPQGPNDAAANKVGAKGGAAKPKTAVPEDTSAMALGKTGARSGAAGGSTVAPPEMSHPLVLAAMGTPSAAGPNAAKLKAGFKGRK